MLENTGIKVKNASKIVADLETKIKNKILCECATSLRNNILEIIEINKKDLELGKLSGIKESFVDRLKLDEKKINQMATELENLAKLPDPIGTKLSTKKLPNNLILEKRRVPFGVVGVIYEARPNVTSDVFGICFKAGSACILKGGKEALQTNIKIVELIKKVLIKNNLPENIIELITDTSRETTLEFMKLNKYLDVLIPRGGAGLIKSVVENSTVPVIETGVGNVHIFVDEFADIKKSIPIIINSKVQRPSVCNSCEKLLIHENIANTFLPIIASELLKNNVEIRGDKKVCEIISNVKLASYEDWETEFLDLVIAIKIVKNIDEAIAHIDKYSTKHSEAILTENIENAEKFLNKIDAAAVYLNASTRFTDGGEFGLGSEVGISTQKLHARGPMGLEELTSYKYVIYGNGQIRK